MNRQEIISYLGDDWNQVRSLIGEALHSDISLLNSTNESIILHSGKMMRPMLALLTARACGGANRDSCLFAAATELLHNATLLHDDVADESVERRGVPTVNALLGGPAAVLVGDFWLARAVEMVLDSSHREDSVVKLFSKTLVDLAEGEMLQLQKASGADTTEEDYYRIIYCKTASLFETACVSAAMSVDACPEYVEAARKYAVSTGLAFQIRDDILDYAGTSELGKPVGIDLKEQKITLPLLGVLKGSAQQEEIRRMVREIHLCAGNCEAVRSLVLNGGGVDYAIAELDGHIEAAVSVLDVLPDSPARTYLEALARFNAFRKV